MNKCWNGAAMNNISNLYKTTVIKLFNIVNPIKYIRQSYKRIMGFYQEIYNKSQNLAKTNYELGVYHLQNSNYLDAFLRFKLITLIWPNYNLARYQLGRALYLQGKLQKAISQLDIAYNSNQEGASAGYMLYLINQAIYPKPNAIPDDIKVDYYGKEVYQEGFQNICEQRAKLMGLEAYAIFKAERINLLDIGAECAALPTDDTFKTILTKSNGITLTNGIKELARQSQAYNTLYDNITECNESEFNLACSMFTFEYENNLSQLLENILSKLSNQGVLMFMIQVHDTENDVILKPEQVKFTYSMAFISSLLHVHNLKVIKMVEFNESDNNMLLCIVQK